ncbi:MAG TPA: hypothetical protein VL475_14235 [Planctomycetaceae bacterium]|jgi:hypothetical protein|nr:hypothetical protein [Planctomycetaceae bacterium]
MNDAFSRFRELAEIARGDEGPPVDVAGKVLARIETGRDATDRRAVDGPTPLGFGDAGLGRLRQAMEQDRLSLVLGAAIAVAAASVALMLGWPASDVMNDSLADWYQQYNGVMQ